LGLLLLFSPGKTGREVRFEALRCLTDRRIGQEPVVNS